MSCSLTLSTEALRDSQQIAREFSGIVLVRWESMAVECAECGETLLGSVNRCWNCGKEFVSRAGDVQLPPRRRTPIVGALAGPLEAEIVEDGQATDCEAVTSHDGRRWKRAGSPFAIIDATTDIFLPDSPLSTNYPTGAGAKGAALASIFLGCSGLISNLLFPIGGLILTSIGIGMGIVGLQSPQRRTAIVGLFLCCVTLAVSAVNVTVRAYNGL